MRESNTARQFVEFAERGFTSVSGVIAEFKRRLFETTRAADLLKESLQSGDYQRLAQDVGASNAALDRLNAQARRIDLETRFGKIGASVILANEKFGQFQSTVQRTVGLIIGPAAVAFGVLTGTVMGFVRAGLQGSVEAFRLNFAYQMLSREIAGVFLPVMEKIVGAIERAAGWFRRLTGHQQDLIMKVVIVAAVMLGATVAIGGLIIGVVGLIGAVLSLTASLVALNVPLAGIPLAIGLVVTALAAIVAGATAAGAGAAGLVSSMDRGGASLDKFGAWLQKIWNVLQPVISATTSWWRILAQLWEIGSRLRDVLWAPFAKLFERLSGGASPLEVLADVLDRIANYMDDAIMPAFEAMAIVLEGRLVKAAQAFADAIQYVGGKVDALFKMLGISNPLVGFMERFYANTRASGGGDRRRPMPMDTGFEDAISTWKRISVATQKANIGMKPPEEETAENTETIATAVSNIERKIDQIINGAAAASDGFKTGVRAGIQGTGLGVADDAVRGMIGMVKAALK